MRTGFKTTLVVTAAGIVTLVAVWVIPVPFSKVEWFVDQHYDYFLKPKEIVNKKHSGIKQIFMGVAELKLRSDWRRQFVKRIQPEINSEVDAIQIVTERIDSLIISGFEFDHLPIYQTTFPNIVRGYGWCDQVNSAVAFTLHELIDGVVAYALVDPETGISNHTCARVNSASLGVVYIDAWLKDIRYFGFEDSLTEKGKQIIPRHRDIRQYNKAQGIGLPYEARFYPSGYVFNKYTFSHQFKSALGRFWDAISSIDWLSKEAVEADKTDTLVDWLSNETVEAETVEAETAEAIEADKADETDETDTLVDWLSNETVEAETAEAIEADKTDTLRLAATALAIDSSKRIDEATIEQQKTFVKARLYHLYGKEIIAKNLYKTLMECDHDIGKVSRIFYKRLSSAN